VTALADMSIEEIMQAEGVVKRSAYTLRRKASLERYGAGADEKMKKKVVAYLTSHGVQPDLERVHDLTGGSMDEVSRAVWSLQGDGEVTFYERFIDGKSHISSIKLAAGVRAKKPPTIKSTRHPVGVDMTDPKNHKAVAVGGPIEVTTLMAPSETTTEWTLTNNRSYVEATAAGTTDKTYLAGMTNTPREYSDFPLIAEILKKKERYDRYVAAAEILSTRLGENYDDYGNEMALKLLENTGLTDLEQEIIRYIELEDR